METRSLIRFFLYLLAKLLVIALVAALAIFVFNCAKETFNVGFMIKDALQKRTTAMLTPEDADTVILERMYTEEYLERSGLLEPEAQSYTVSSFRQTLDIGYAIVWAWQKEVQLDVTDTIDAVNAEYRDGEGEPSADDVYESGRYRVKLRKEGGQWRIYDVLLIERIYADSREESSLRESAAAA